MTVTRSVRLTRGFLRLKSRDQARVVACWVLLGVSRLLIAVIPASRTGHLLGGGSDTSAFPALSGDERRARRIGRLTSLAARHTPWTSSCYPQALTARLQLRAARIPHTVTFGMQRGPDGLTAHVWVTAGDVAVTGGDGSRYAVVGSFPWSPGS